MKQIKDEYIDNTGYIGFDEGAGYSIATPASAANDAGNLQRALDCWTNYVNYAPTIPLGVAANQRIGRFVNVLGYNVEVRVSLFNGAETPLVPYPLYADVPGSTDDQKRWAQAARDTTPWLRGRPMRLNANIENPTVTNLTTTAGGGGTIINTIGAENHIEMDQFTPFTIPWRVRMFIFAVPIRWTVNEQFNFTWNFVNRRRKSSGTHTWTVAPLYWTNEREKSTNDVDPAISLDSYGNLRGEARLLDSQDWPLSKGEIVYKRLLKVKHRLEWDVNDTTGEPTSCLNGFQLLLLFGCNAHGDSVYQAGMLPAVGYRFTTYYTDD